MPVNWLPPRNVPTMNNFGYNPDPDGTHRFVATLGKFQDFDTCAADLLSGEDEDRDGLAYRAMNQCTGEKRLISRNQQNCGSCVGHGTGSGVDITVANAVISGTSAQRWVQRAACDAMYAIGCNAAGDHGGDGSSGYAASKGLMETGMLHMLQYPGYDLTGYSVDRCRSWKSRSVPAEMVAIANQHKMMRCVRLKSCEEARTMLQHGYGVNACSGQGFSGVRDEDGFMKASGSWSHSMAVIGYRGARSCRSGRRGFLIWQSWGSKWGSGPIWPDDMPWASFWCDWDVFDRMVRGGDTFAYCDPNGFVPRHRNFWDAALGSDVFTPNFNTAA